MVQRMPELNEKRIGIMQPYFLPYLGYWQLMNKVSHWIIFDDVQFVNKGWINRNQITHPNSANKTLWLSIPLKDRKQSSLIRDIAIDIDQRWKKEIMGKMTHLKNKTKYYDEGISLLKNILSMETKWLIELLIHSIDQVKETLGIKCETSIQSTHFSEVSYDLELDAGEWALYLTQAANGTHYLNPITGKHLFSNEKFQEANLILEYFYPDLDISNERNFSLNLSNSIVETICRYGVDQVSKFLQKGSIVEARHV